MDCRTFGPVLLLVGLRWCVVLEPAASCYQTWHRTQQSRGLEDRDSCRREFQLTFGISPLPRYWSDIRYGCRPVSRCRCSQCVKQRPCCCDRPKQCVSQGRTTQNLVVLELPLSFVVVHCDTCDRSSQKDQLREAARNRSFAKSDQGCYAREQLGKSSELHKQTTM
jgi:hypothetical protein